MNTSTTPFTSTFPDGAASRAAAESGKSGCSSSSPEPTAGWAERLAQHVADMARSTERPSPMEAASIGKPWPMTDLGNAERFAFMHSASIKWDVARKAWRAWDGRRWAIDGGMRVHALAAQTVRSIRKEAAAAPSAKNGERDVGGELFRHALKSESRDRLAALIEVAKSQAGIAIAAESLDRDPWLLNVGNGTLDLRTGKLMPHDRRHLITKITDVKYDPTAKSERWESFLRDSTNGDDELITFLQVAAGYSLTGDTSEEILFLVFGPEASGKTTFVECLKSALGEYARTVSSDLLTRSKMDRNAGSATPEIAGLAGARLAAASELEQGKELAEALAKNLTGGEKITCRHLYGELFDFQPQFKLWLALNHCPRVSAEDGAMWRRIRRIGFEHTVPREKRDRTLKPFLRDPKGGAPAVLAWAVKGCLRWQREGLTIPLAVERSTAAYRDESDPLAAFIEDRLMLVPNAWTSWQAVWEAYTEHCEDAGTPLKYRVAPKRLQDRLKALNCSAEKHYAGRGWRGVELKSTPENPDHGGHGGQVAFSKSIPSEAITRNTLENRALDAMGGMEPEKSPLKFAEPDPFEVDELP